MRSALSSSASSIVVSAARGLQVTGNVARSRWRIVSLFANHKRHRLAAKARDAFREHGLVGERRDHPIAIRAGHILGGEDGDDPGMSALERLDVAENECGVRVRRAHRARRKRLRRPFVGAEDFRSGELADAVEAGNATSDRGLRRQFHDFEASKRRASFTASRMAR